MLDHLITQLTQLRVWVELLFTAAVAYAIYRMGRALLLWVDSLARQRGVAPLAPWLKWLWRLGVVVSWVAVATNILNLPQLDMLYELGRHILRAFQASAGQLLVIGALVAIAWPLIGILTSHIAAGEERSRDAVRLQTLRGVVESALKVLLVIVAVLAGVQALGINPTSLLAGVSVFGLAVSFGAQNLVRDVLNGFFFLLEDQFGVGDRITINGKELTGDVERLNLRVTTLRHRQTGAIHIIPNGEIKKVTVERKGRNWNRVEALARVSYDDDLEQALDVFERTCLELYEDAAWKEEFIEKPIVQGVHELGEYEIYLRALLTVRPTKQGQVKREFNRRIKHAFDQAGLNIAPNRTTTIGNVVQMRLVGEQKQEGQEE